MALTGHTAATRIYGQVFGTAPFTNPAGTQSYFANVKPFPNAPLSYIQLANTTIWPLPTGYLVGNSYVYSVLELTPTGLNQPSIKLASDQSAATIASNAT